MLDEALKGNQNVLGQAIMGHGAGSVVGRMFQNCDVVNSKIVALLKLFQVKAKLNDDSFFAFCFLQRFS